MLIIKLAAIGDIVLLSRALKYLLPLKYAAMRSMRPESPKSSKNPKSPKIRWVIDQALLPLASRIISEMDFQVSPIESNQAPVHLNIEFIPIDSRKLFQGRFFDKLKVSFKLFFIGIHARAPFFGGKVLILHRDRRYRVVFAPFYLLGKVFCLNRRSIGDFSSEYTSYVTLLSKALELKSENTKVQKNPRFDENQWQNHLVNSIKKSFKKIGILVGGAKNQKLLYEEKRWPYFESLIEKLSKDETVKEIYLYGSEDDRSLTLSFSKAVLNNPKIQNSIGLFKLEELADSFKELDVFIGIDSGPTHIASQVMTKPHQRVLFLFGPTDPRIWVPEFTASAPSNVTVLYKATACSPCYKEDGVFHKCKFGEPYFKHCMTSISVDEVLSKI